MIQPAEKRGRLLLTVITDPSARVGVIAAVEGALRGGATAIQLRWKGAASRDLLEQAHAIRRLTSARDALFIVNDRVDIAMAASADGTHLGDDDLPLSVARRIVPAGFTLGKSVDNAKEAEMAEREGADYVGFGPIFLTGTKADLPAAVGSEAIAGVRSRTNLPIVAIGGIDVEGAARVIRAGADGIAVVSAVMSAHDPEDATRRLRAALGG
jgi:thiamine-phosphate pyrophosphorylase